MVYRQASAFILWANLILWRISVIVSIPTGILLTDIYIQELTFYISSMSIIMQAFTNPTEKFKKNVYWENKVSKISVRIEWGKH